MIIIDSVKPTAAVASGPSFDTQKMSATAKIDSMLISRTMGTASSTIARPRGIWVKSGRDPRSDSRTRDQKFLILVIGEPTTLVDRLGLDEPRPCRHHFFEAETTATHALRERANIGRRPDRRHPEMNPNP